MIVASTIFPLLLVSGGLTANMHPEEKIERHFFAGLGSGLSVAGYESGPLRDRSPFYVNVGASFCLSQKDWLILDAGVQLEFERRIGIGLLPRARVRFPSFGPVDTYGGLALPFFIYEYSLYGIQALGGVSWNAGDAVAVFAEPTIGAFFGGSDLIKGRGLVKFDLTLGVSVRF